MAKIDWAAAWSLLRKYGHVLPQVLQLAEDAVAAAKDGKLSPEEEQQLGADVAVLVQSAEQG